MRQRPESTVLLTTHYMVEADELCDRVAIINGGKVLACDSPAVLKRQLQREAIFELEVGPLNGVTSEQLRAIPGVRRLVHRPAEGGATLEFMLDEESVLPAVVGWLADGAVALRHLQNREPTLEDVFVKLVGMRMEEVEGDASD